MNSSNARKLLGFSRFKPILFCITPVLQGVTLDTHSYTNLKCAKVYTCSCVMCQSGDDSIKSHSLVSDTCLFDCSVVLSIWFRQLTLKSARALYSEFGGKNFDNCRNLSRLPPSGTLLKNAGAGYSVTSVGVGHQTLRKDLAMNDSSGARCLCVSEPTTLFPSVKRRMVSSTHNSQIALSEIALVPISVVDHSSLSYRTPNHIRCYTPMH
jgi:hypothetical protein